MQPADNQYLERLCDVSEQQIKFSKCTYISNSLFFTLHKPRLWMPLYGQCEM